MFVRLSTVASDGDWLSSVYGGENQMLRRGQHICPLHLLSHRASEGTYSELSLLPLSHLCLSLSLPTQSSCSPVYTHLVLVELGPSCPPSGTCDILNLTIHVPVAALHPPPLPSSPLLSPGQLVFEVYHLQTEADSKDGSEEGWDPTNPGSLETAVSSWGYPCDLMYRI